MFRFVALFAAALLMISPAAQAEDTMVLKMLPEQPHSLLQMMRLLSPARRSTLMAVPSPRRFVVEND